jgi:dTDP-4-dehydrorhamnose 3,5-epimerase
MQINEIYPGGPSLIEMEPKGDSRGTFTRVFCNDEFEKASISFIPKQCNLSKSTSPGTVRGLHFQYKPKCESKYVRVISGSIFDVVVDLNPGENFLRVETFTLSSNQNLGLLVPKGFAHGFQTLEIDTSVEYLVDEKYSMQHESGLRWNDPSLEISWPMDVTCISDRDKGHDLLIGNKFLELETRFK